MAGVPLLAAALRRALLSRQPELGGRVPDTFFMPAVAACDAADREYRELIQHTLPFPKSQKLLAAMATFRERVHAARMAARAEIAELRSVGAQAADVDPLDVVPPRIDGLSHVDAVRIGDIGDRARREMEALRQIANGRIAPLLDAESLAALVEAKKERIVAFHGAMHAALAPLAPLDRMSSLVEGLAQVAETWY